MKTLFLAAAVAAPLVFGLPVAVHAAQLEGVRLGIHDGYTRVVADLDAAPGTVQVEIDGTTATVRIEGAMVPASLGLPAPRGPLLAPGMRAKAAEDGLVILIPLQGTAVAKTQKFTPDSYGGHRIVVDLHGRGAMRYGANEETLSPTDAARRDAALALGAGDAAKACAILGKTFPAGSWDLEAMLLEGQCLAEQGEIGKARGLYQQMLAFDPTLERIKIELNALPTDGDAAAEEAMHSSEPVAEGSSESDDAPSEQ